MSEKLVANLTYNNTLQLTTQLLKNDPVFLNTKLHCKGNRKKEKKNRGDCLLPEFRIYQISFNIPHF